MIFSRMVLASPGHSVLTPPRSSSPPKTPIRSYSAQTPPRNGNPTQPQPVGCGCTRKGRGTGGQDGPQAYADVLQQPNHSSTVQRPSADNTTVNQTTTSHRCCGRDGRESHDCMANNNEGSPRLQCSAPTTYEQCRTAVPIIKLFLNLCLLDIKTEISIL
jgi:hypothetical protein